MMETYRKEDIRRGDIYYADLRPVVGSEQGGIRPVVILQNNVGNRHSPTVIAAAITSRKGKHKLPTHVNLDAPVPGLYRDSIILLEQLAKKGLLTVDEAEKSRVELERKLRPTLLFA